MIKNDPTNNCGVRVWVNVHESVDHFIKETYKSYEALNFTFLYYSGPVGSYYYLEDYTAYIEEHNLGEVTQTPARMNLQHGPNKIRCCVWEPDWKALKEHVKEMK